MSFVSRDRPRPSARHEGRETETEGDREIETAMKTGRLGHRESERHEEGCGNPVLLPLGVNFIS